MRIEFLAGGNAEDLLPAAGESPALTLNKPMSQKEETITIGKYVLTKLENGGCWIEVLDDGEGGEFDESAIAAAIEKLYKEQF